MSNFHINRYSGAPNQKGAALIVTLMLLVIMTILGISAVVTTTMEEKMSGATINKHVSFQAAEAAMRAAEEIVNTLSADTVFNGTNGLYSRSSFGDTDFPIWDPEDGSVANWQDITTVPTGGTGEPVQSPEYIIEDFGTSYRDADCALVLPLPAGCELPIYRVTSRGFGLNTNGFSMIQGTYKQL